MQIGILYETCYKKIKLVISIYTQRDNSVNLQCERLLNLHEDFTRILHDFTCTLLSKTVQDVETNDNPVNLTALSC